jgi:hypothetical protein
MNQDLTQSNLSIARDGVTITINGPAWLIKDIYERETAPTIRIESANPEAPATPKEWPVFQLGDRVRYVGSDRLGVIDVADQGPRVYGVVWNDGSFGRSLGVRLEKVDDEPQPEPPIEALAQEDSEVKRRRGIKNYWATMTPEERKQRTEKMRAARHPKKSLVPVHAGHVQEDGLVRHGSGVLNFRATVARMSVGQQLFIPGASARSVYNAASKHGYKVRTTVTREGVRVWRVQ